MMSTENVEKKLSNAEKMRIERNKLKAQSLRQAKLVSHPFKKPNSNVAEATTTDSESVIKIQGTKFVDSGGGFLLEKTLLENDIDKKDKDAKQIKLSEEEPIEIPVNYEECLECEEPFLDSFLLNNFNHKVCDKCYDRDVKHPLITRSEAKAEYLLKDCDFDKRGPPLRYISRKNPHNVRWGEMKLYLLSQVEKRAMEVWGTEEELERQHEQREQKREVSKVRKYNKNMKQLRMEMRSSLYKKKTHVVHKHEFGPENYNEEDDTYTHNCLTCPFTETFEKL